MNENITSALASEFNRQCLPRRCYFGVNVYVPVIFIGGPIHDLADATTDDSPIFRSCDGMMTRVRVPGWPGRLRRELLGYTAEAPVFITNQAGLTPFLTTCLEGFLGLEASLKRVRPRFADRWPIEAAFYQMALVRFLEREDSALRSDLDIFQWLHPLPRA